MLDKEMKIDKKMVGLRIRHIRVSKGYTLEAFGKLFNAKKSNVQNWEVGKYLPNKKRLNLISEYSNITVDELLYGFDEGIQRVYAMALKLNKKDKMILVKKIMESMINEEYR